ncbi:MAG: LytTR family transcriptional regulator [Rhodobacterales bacterium 32-67-9]|nr:MAG: LytTR family transcriptional regulator [Rhodobacterales bacterium 32-67-9]
MLILGPIGFTVPWLLWGLVALPVLWFLLRAIPPAPIRRRFPGVALLLGLKDEDQQADRTPWWLLLMRMLAVAAIIAGFAGPVLNPEEKPAGAGPLLIVTDGSWASARDWTRTNARISAALSEAGRAGRPVAMVSLTDVPAEGPVFAAADAVAAGLPSIQPTAWEPSAAEMDALAATLPEGAFDTLWLSDGIARDGRAALLAALDAHGAVTAVESARNVVALGAAGYEGGTVSARVLRARTEGPGGANVVAHGLDPAGIERELARAGAEFTTGEGVAVAEFDLPPELRNRITRFEVAGEATAGAVALADDALKRRKVALVTGGTGREGLELLAPDHYLRQALEPTADLIEGTIGDVLLASPDVIILADIAKVAEVEDVTDWIEEGGLLVRFAGPHLAASDVGRDTLDPLLPVRLRIGGRAVGGTMSWGEPKALAPFPETSPFAGLVAPPDVAVTAQVLAQPGPDLAEATVATLADGTPLVTRRQIGDGQVVLFHVSANAEWTTLPLSGLFVQMLERLAITSRAARPEEAELAGTTWVAEKVLDGFGALGEATELPGVPGERLAEGQIGPDLPPGLYSSGDRQLAVNVIAPDRVLAPTDWPAGVVVEGLAVAREVPLKGWILGVALALLMADLIASMALAGRLGGERAGIAVALLALLTVVAPGDLRAQEALSEKVVKAAGNVVLAHVLTGDTEIDRVAEAGLWGLSEVLFARTSVEPTEPQGVNLETDELSVFTFLYWPVTAGQTAPSPAAYAKLNRYLRTGGMILFDTRDSDVAGFGAASPEGRRLQALAAPLDIPPLEPIPNDHVLTRSFYLLQDFPGRHPGRAVWVEAAPADAELAEGMPFRNLNDGVTPVVIGGNDWAAAWAVDDQNRPLFPVGRGLGGERQRELSYRFGVNLIMHVLTGNYKSDQVHVPALLERLGQ